MYKLFLVSLLFWKNGIERSQIPDPKTDASLHLTFQNTLSFITATSVTLCYFCTLISIWLGLCMRPSVRLVSLPIESFFKQEEERFTEF